MSLLPKRHANHVIDEKAIKRFYQVCPDNWIVRELTARDYGVDRAIEIFNQENPTGGILFFQIKGFDARLKTGSKLNRKLSQFQKIKFRHEIKNIHYSFLFSVPLILIICPINSNEVPRFIWLQEYALAKLDAENSPWRDKKSGKISIEFGQENIFDDKGIKKLERIAQHHLVQKDVSAIWLQIGNLRRVVQSLSEIKNYSGILSKRKDIIENIELAIGEIELRSKSLKNIPWIYIHQLPNTSIRRLFDICNIIKSKTRFLVKDWSYLNLSPHSKTEPPTDFDVIDSLIREISVLTENMKYVFTFFHDPWERNHEYLRTGNPGY